jgi:hypothetical protein
MKIKKAPSKRIFNTTHGAFISPIGLPGEVYGVFIGFAIIQTHYTLDGYELSKAGTLQSSPIQGQRYVWVEAGGGRFEMSYQDV